MSPENENMTYLEIWINRKENGFLLDHPGLRELPLGAGQLSFSDFDADGDIDIVFPVCWPRPNCSEECSIRIALNQQKKMCSSNPFASHKNCRKTFDLCQADDQYEIPDLNTTESSKYYKIINLKDAGIDQLAVNDQFNTITLRRGDYNLDGYPDLLIPFVDEEGKRKVQLWENEKGKSLERVSKGTRELEELEDVIDAAFFDIDENVKCYFKPWRF